MGKTRNNIIENIIKERERYANLPGSEYDAKHTPNDWISMIGHYVNREACRSNFIPEKNDFEDSLTKAAAIIVAALEHLEVMKDNKEIK